MSEFTTKKLTLKNYLIAFFVFILTAIVFVVSIVAIPYLLFLMLKIFFLSLEFTVLFVVFFWIVAIGIVTILRLLEYGEK